MGADGLSLVIAIAGMPASTDAPSSVSIHDGKMLTPVVTAMLPTISAGSGMADAVIIAADFKTVMTVPERLPLVALIFGGTTYASLSCSYTPYVC